MVEDIFALAVGLQIGGRRGGRPPVAIDRIGSGVQPVPSPTLPEVSSSERKAWREEGIVLARERIPFGGGQARKPRSQSGR